MRPGRVVALLAVAALLAAACSGERDAPNAPLAFCKAASEFDYQLDRGAKLPEQIRLLEKVVEAAPPKIADDAQIFLVALEQVQSHPAAVKKDDPKVKQAADNVHRYAAQGCDFYARRSGGI